MARLQPSRHSRNECTGVPSSIERGNGHYPYPHVAVDLSKSSNFIGGMDRMSGRQDCDRMGGMAIF